ncbi:hypothetical protein HDU82_003445 [Entophlyctis luteolus]|nr:hypothetical protein HDU82_003445 [Entophlyctis luteolus]
MCYTTFNLLANAARGMSIGTSLLGLTIGLLSFKLVPKSTFYSIVLICILIITDTLAAITYDYLLLQSCFFRVKVIYCSVFLSNAVYWIFEANLAYRVSLSAAHLIIGHRYIFTVAVILRTIVGIFLPILYDTSVASNAVCLTVISQQIIVVDKVTEMVYSSALSALFVFAVWQGVVNVDKILEKQIEAKFNDMSNTWAHAGRKYLMSIIHGQGLILLLKLGSDAAYLTIVLILSDPTAIGCINALFRTQPVVLLCIHIAQSGARHKDSRKSQSIRVSKPVEDREAA